jgi:iron complex transport system substrate-binding protein
MAEPRIVSLLPAATEIACALGFRAALVGRSHECDHPPGVESLPACTRPRLADGTSGEIDAHVRSLVARALSIYEVDEALLRALAPSVILTQHQCEVCAVSQGDVEAALGSTEWLGARPAIVSLAPATLGEVFEDVQRVGDALGAAGRARELVAALTARVSELGERSGPLERPAVACLEWLDPPMAPGHWLPELVALAGGRNVLGETAAPSVRIAWEALAAADPDVLVCAPCGFDLARTLRELAGPAARPEWRALRAVREGRVFAVDGSAFFSRPGPRLVDSIEILGEILHPERFAPRHRSTGWERVA